MEIESLQAILTLLAYPEAAYLKYKSQKELEDSRTQGRLKTSWIF